MDKKISLEEFDNVVQKIFDEDDGYIAWTTFDKLRNQLFGEEEHYYKEKE